MIYRRKRDRFLESLSLGSRYCPECKTVSLSLAQRQPTIITCSHCNGEWSLKKDKYSLERERYDNITPGYIEEGA